MRKPVANSHRLPLVEATRAWRKGVRTVILLNDTLPSELARRRDYRRAAQDEVYLTYEDVDNSAVWWLKKGDLRCCALDGCYIGFVLTLMAAWQATRQHCAILDGLPGLTSEMRTNRGPKRDETVLIHCCRMFRLAQQCSSWG